MAADLDPRDFSEVRRRVVDPVLAGVLRADELEHVGLLAEGDTILVAITACGETVYCFLGEVGASRWDAVATAEHLYDSLTDDLPTTGFAWGEERSGRYDLPGPCSE